MIDREKLLQAAQRLDNSSGSGSGSSDSDSEPRRRTAHKEPHSKHSRKRKEKDSRGKKKKDSKDRSHKRHKRSEHDKIAEAERRAAAMGATRMLPSLGRHGVFGTPAATGDAAMLDTSGDANNAIYESLYGGDVARYNRLDPMNLVHVTRRLGGQAGDADVGNTRTDRYYRGRHFLQERDRAAKRIHLADLRQQQHGGKGARSTLPLPPPVAAAPAASLAPRAPGGAASAAAAASGPTPGLGASSGQEPQQGLGSRRLDMPALSFIPLETPQGLLKQQQQQGNAEAGNWWQQQQQPAGVPAAKQQAIEPTVLVEQAGLTPDELLLEATRAWNVAIRERPHEEELWLQFAAFQHTAAAAQQPQRGRVAATSLMDPVTAEKQVSLLTRGLAHHPSSSLLLRALLRAYAAVAPDAESLEAKWAGVLARQAGSWQLWREYIALRQSSFAEFKVSGQQKVYQDALHSLQLELQAHRRKAATAHKQQHRQQLPILTQQQVQQLTPLAAAAVNAATAGSSGSGSSSGLLLGLTLGEEALELQLVQLLLGLLRLEFEAGYSEQALAKIQALLEFHLFAPPLSPGGVPALLRLFAAYWTAGVARIGEAGARGWAYWCLWHAMGMEQPSAAAAAAEEEEKEEERQRAAEGQQQEPAGWSGWFDVPAQQQQLQDSERAAAEAGAKADAAQPSAAAEAAAAAGAATAIEDRDAGASSGDEGEVESEQQQQEDEEASEESELNEEELMQQLGLQLEQQLQAVEKEGLPPKVLARWVQQEASCCADQWQPLRPDSTPADPASEPPEPARIASLHSVEPCLFLLRSKAALHRLVLGCVELLGVQVGFVPWCSSNSPTPYQQQSLRKPQWPTEARGSSRGAAAAGGATTSRGVSWTNAAAAEGAGHVEGQQQQQQQWQHSQHVPWCAASEGRWQLAVNVLQRLVAGGPCSDWPELCLALLLLHASKACGDGAAAAAAAAAGAGDTEGQAGQAGDAAAGVLGGLLQQLTLDGATGAASTNTVVAATASSSSSSSSSSRQWPSQEQLAAARAAAKQLLSDQQDNLLLYDAYGCLEAAAGQVKTARKVLESALTLASAAATGTAGTSTGSTGSSTTAGPQLDSTAAAAAAPLLALHLAQLELGVGGQAALSRAHVALHALLAKQPLQAAAAVEAAAGAASKQPQQQQPPQQQQQQGLLGEQHLRAARLGFQKQVPELLASAGGFLTTAAASSIAAAALFELVVGLRQGTSAAGLSAAVAVCRQVTAAVPEAVRAASVQHEQLAVLQCHMLVAAATGGGSSRSLVPGPGGAAAHTTSSSSSSSIEPAVAAALAAAVAPGRAREALGAAIGLYPHSQALLQLQVALDTAAYTLAGLRQQLTALAELHSSPGLWAVVLQAEAQRPGGRLRLGVAFERALSAPTALQWQLQEQQQRQRVNEAWAAACADLQQQRRGEQERPTPAEQRQQLLLQPATAAGSAAAALDLALWDGYRGWGHCAALWQQYIQYELGLGRPDAARKLFLRAVHAAPGAKALWLSGLRAVCGGLQPRECSGLLEVMQEREVLLRTDVYEVLLAFMAEQGQSES